MSVGGRGDARRRFRARFHWWELVKKGGGGLLVYFWWRWPIFASIRKKFFRRFEMEWIDLEFDQFWKRMIFFFQLMYNRVDHVRSLFEFWNPLTFPGTKNFLVPAPSPSLPLLLMFLARFATHTRISRFLKQIRLIYARNMHAVHVFVTTLTTATGTLSKDNMCSDNTSYVN